MSNLLYQIIGGILSFWLAVEFVPGVEFTGELKYLAMAGAFLGLINFFIKPILKTITLPLRFLTFGLFSLIINMALIWFVDVVFPELTVAGIIPLFWTTVIVWLIGYFLGRRQPKNKKTII
ncbi:MAG TPA: phage holin family protein [Patescibacteria group bacterium]|nr:phage holin family protein [Patescibacteria group bacterium]